MTPSDGALHGARLVARALLARPGLLRAERGSAVTRAIVTPRRRPPRPGAAAGWSPAAGAPSSAPATGGAWPGAAWPHAAPTRSPRVAVVSDTLDDVNGLALGLRRLAAACADAGLPLTLVAPDLLGRRARSRAGGPVGARGLAGGAVWTDDAGVARVPTHLRRELALYPGMTWGVPRLAALAAWLRAARVEVVQVATPGPMGLAGLVAARALGLPVLAQFHTDVPAYAHALSGSPTFGAAAAGLVGWFYRQADLCLAPSAAVERRLADLGVPAPRVGRVPRGVDLALFHPGRRDRAALARLGDLPGPVVLYLGRLSREKGLPRLLAAWARVHAARPDARLLLVGDGPLAGELGATPGHARRGDPGPPAGVVRAGELHGPALAAAVASADLLAFPSETETFGNAVAEALAAGLPAVVAAGGAARELVAHGVDGLVVEVEGAQDPDGVAFGAAISALLDDPARRRRMGEAAHARARRLDQAAAARATFEVYRRFLADRAAGAAEAGATLRRRGGAA